MEINGDVITWLMAGDPAIRWQVMQDILHADSLSVEKERLNIVSEGWGARLLSYQDPDGLWAGQLYDHKWISTTYSMLLLRQMGLSPEHEKARLACYKLLNGGYQSEGALSYSKTRKVFDLCVNGIVLSILAYFHYQDERVHRIAEYLLDQQCDDGHWEPYLNNTSMKYCFDTTLLVLEGLDEYTRHYPDRRLFFDHAISLGIEFLLTHHIFLNDQGKSIEKKWTLFSFPPRWHYDVLAVMDFLFRIGFTYDSRMDQAINLIQSKQRADGRWALQNRHAGKTYFEMEKPGEPSRWNTLRALRALSLGKD